MEPVPDHLDIDCRQRVYLARYGQSIEAVSFEDVAALSDAVAGRLGRPTLALGRRCNGSPEDYLHFRRLLKLAAEQLPRDETWYDPRTVSGVRVALETALVTQCKVRLHYGDPSTGTELATGESADGFVRRAGDTELPHLLLCASPKPGAGSRPTGSRAGQRIYDNAIVRITSLKDHYDLWCHPRFAPPQGETVPLLNGRVRLLRGRVVHEFADDRSAVRHLTQQA